MNLGDRISAIRKPYHFQIPQISFLCSQRRHNGLPSACVNRINANRLVRLLRCAYLIVFSNRRNTSRKIAYTSLFGCGYSFASIIVTYLVIPEIIKTFNMFGYIILGVVTTRYFRATCSPLVEVGDLCQVLAVCTCPVWSDKDGDNIRVGYIIEHTCDRKVKGISK